MMSPDLPFWGILWMTNSHAFFFTPVSILCLFLIPFMEYQGVQMQLQSYTKLANESLSMKSCLPGQIASPTTKPRVDFSGHLMKRRQNGPCFANSVRQVRHIDNNAGSGLHNAAIRTLLDAGHTQSWSGMNLRLIKQCR